MITSLVLLAPLDRNASASTIADGASAVKPHEVAPRSNPGEIASALHSYAARAAGLRRRSLDSGKVSYQDVVDIAYADGVIGPDVLRSKARWRASLGGPFTVITDYSAVRAAAAVRPFVAVRNPVLRSTLVARYESTVHAIDIAPAATDFTLFHEAGHTLQRAALLGHGVAAADLDDPLHLLLGQKRQPDAAGATTDSRFEYLCSQHEFEVRLQDLNRFHSAVVSGRPIMSPSDSVRALTALGVRLTFEETNAAFRIAGQEFSREDFALAVASGPVEADGIAAAFEDARELCMMRWMAKRLDEARWISLLAKIIFEAPAHL